MADLEVVDVENAGELLDLELGGLSFRLAEIRDQPRRDQRRQQTQNGQNDEKLDEGEALFTPASLKSCFHLSILLRGPGAMGSTADSERQVIGAQYGRQHRAD